MNNGALLSLINNAALLLALGVLYETINLRTQARTLVMDIMVGLGIGIIGVVVMLTPWQLAPGVVFDTRSILLSVTGLFFGLIPTIAAALTTSFFRLYQGGAGAWTGVLVIIVSAGLGLAWRYWRQRPLATLGWLELYGFGVVVHLVMLVCMLTLPQPIAREVLSKISLPVMVVYPIGVTLLGRLLAQQLIRAQTEVSLRERERQLRESEARFRRAVEEAPFPIIIHAEDGQILSLSQTWTELTGYTSAEIPTIPDWTVRAYGAHQEQVQSAIDRLYALSGREDEGEFLITCKDGSQRVWQFSSTGLGRGTDGRRVVISMAVDVTERRQWEEQLKERNQFIETILENLPIGLAVNYVDEGTAMYMNREFENIYGWPKEMLTNIEDFFQCVYPDPEYRQQIQAQIWADIASGDPARMQWTSITITTQDGRQKIIAAKNIPLLEQNLMISTVQDITDQKLAEEKLRLLNIELEQRVAERTAQLEAKNRELESFTYSVSHDLKAPLRGIDGYSQLLQQDYAHRLDGDGHLFIENVRKAARQMSQLIDDLLAYSRMERRSLHARPVDPQTLIAGLLSERAAVTQSENFTVTVDVPCDSLAADPEALSIALRNLLDNAIKFSKNGVKPAIEIGGRQTETSCILWVRDNGVGFDMKFHNRIFAIFQRLHRPEDYPGTGIGLAIVRKVMERMGGRVWAESEPEQGATFYLEIPRPI